MGHLAGEGPASRQPGRALHVPGCSSHSSSDGALCGASNRGGLCLRQACWALQNRGPISWSLPSSSSQDWAADTQNITPPTMMLQIRLQAHLHVDAGLVHAVDQHELGVHPTCVKWQRRDRGGLLFGCTQERQMSGRSVVKHARQQALTGLHD